MKILIWAPFINKVGTTSNVINSIEALMTYPRDKIYSVDLINAFGEWDNYTFEDKKINVINLLTNKFILKADKKGFLKSRFYTILIFIFAAWPLFKLIKKNKYDYIISYLITSLPITLFSLINSSSKLILSISGFPKLTNFRKLFWKFSKNNIYKIICPSYETKELLSKARIFNSNQLVVIKDPHVSTKKILNFSKEKINDLPFKDNKFLISIGRLTKQKNFIFLIEAFKNIQKYKNNLHLMIIGDGEEKIKIEKKIKELNLIDNVHLIGYQKNIYKYLKKSFCYVSTSLWEGPDLAILDASYCNIPIICSDCKSGRKEFINKGERGYIFKTNDMDSFLFKFQNFMKEDKEVLKQKLLKSKKEVKNFTKFRYYQSLKNILI